MTKTVAERQRDFTARKKNSGQVLFRVWVDKRLVPLLKNHVEELKRISRVVDVAKNKTNETE